MKRSPANKLRLQYKIIILFFTSFILPIIVFGSFLLFSFRRILENNLYNNQTTSLQQFKDGFDKYLIDFDRISRSLSYDITFSRALSKGSKDFPDIRDFDGHTESIISRLSAIVNENSDIRSVHLFTDSGTVYSTTEESLSPSAGFIRNLDWFRQIQDGQFRAVLLNPTDILSLSSINEEIIPFATNIKITYLRQKEVKNGVLIFILSRDFIDQLLSRRYEFVDTLFLFNMRGELIYSSNDEIVVKVLPEKMIEKINTVGQGHHRMNAKKLAPTLMSFITSRFNNIKIVSSSSTDKIQSDIQLLSRFTILFLVLLGMVFIFFIFLLSRSISRPIDNLNRITHELEEFNYDHYTILPGAKQSGLLDTYFNHLIEILDSMILQINEHHKKEKEQELLILQSQINPHFINNSLNAIRTMADIKGEHELAHAVRSLIHLLQSSIKIGQIFISIQEEVSQIKDYIYLQSLRYSNSFTVNYDIDADVLHYKTIKFILQPIVENAVFHGVNAMKSGGEILISIQKRRERIEYSVGDNGAGISPVLLEKLLQGPSDNGETDRIGLMNVNLRLKKYFGEERGLTISSRQGAGTVVSFSIPAELKEGSSA